MKFKTVMDRFSTFARTTAEAGERFSSTCTLMDSVCRQALQGYLSLERRRTKFPVFAASANALMRCLASFNALRRSSTDSPRVNERFGGVFRFHHKDEQSSISSSIHPPSPLLPEGLSRPFVLGRNRERQHRTIYIHLAVARAGWVVSAAVGAQYVFCGSSRSCGKPNDASKSECKNSRHGSILPPLGRTSRNSSEAERHLISTGIRGMQTVQYRTNSST